jgi:hypothetical protein
VGYYPGAGPGLVQVSYPINTSLPRTIYPGAGLFSRPLDLSRNVLATSKAPWQAGIYRAPLVLGRVVVNLGAVEGRTVGFTELAGEMV